MAKINAYRKDTGEKVRIPEHWIGHPVHGKSFTTDPDAAPEAVSPDLAPDAPLASATGDTPAADAAVVTPPAGDPQSTPSDGSSPSTPPAITPADGAPSAGTASKSEVAKPTPRKEK